MSHWKKDAYLWVMKAGGEKVPNFPITWGKRALLFFCTQAKCGIGTCHTPSSMLDTEHKRDERERYGLCSLEPTPELRDACQERNGGRRKLNSRLLKQLKCSTCSAEREFWNFKSELLFQLISLAAEERNIFLREHYSFRKNILVKRWLPTAIPYPESWGR